MDLLSWFQALPYILLFLNWYFQLFNQAWLYILLLLLDPFFSHFFNIELGEFYPFRSKAANLLVLGSDDYKRSVILNFSDEDERILGIETPPYSRLSSMGRIKFNLSDFGELRPACRVWKDYCAKRDAIVYVVNACAEQFSEARREINYLLSDKDLENVPFLIFCETPEPSYPSERELCILLGLTGRTTGQGRVQLAGNARPLEVFVAEASNRRQHQDAIKWLSQYINGH
nr:GTP-binding protein SAR2-like [Quercus suber]POE59466.1 gtp-binding protein sar2 [Quercus suber]